MAGKEILQKGMIRRIGDGSELEMAAKQVSGRIDRSLCILMLDLLP
jgi:hypothetical protein